MELAYRKATLDDLDDLVKTRMKVLRTANELPESAEMSLVETQARNIMRKVCQRMAMLPIWYMITVPSSGGGRELLSGDADVL
jgi:hypothetical protein